jgi:hypothetical protein
MRSGSTILILYGSAQDRVVIGADVDPRAPASNVIRSRSHRTGVRDPTGPGPGPPPEASGRKRLVGRKTFGLNPAGIPSDPAQPASTIAAMITAMPAIDPPATTPALVVS